MANKISSDEAKKIVLGLGEQWGSLDEEMMGKVQNWEPDIHRKIQKAFLCMETAAAHSVKT